MWVSPIQPAKSRPRSKVWAGGANASTAVLEREAPGVPASILEGIDGILTVARLGLPTALRRPLACTNIIENMNGTVRQVCRNVKRWQDAFMALRWTSAAKLGPARAFAV